MQYAYNMLRGRIVEKCGNQGKFTKKMGLSDRSVSMKLSGQRQWTQKDIVRACDVLDIPYAEIPAYFFAPEVR